MLYQNSSLSFLRFVKQYLWLQYAPDSKWERTSEAIWSILLHSLLTPSPFLAITVNRLPCLSVLMAAWLTEAFWSVGKFALAWTSCCCLAKPRNIVTVSDEIFSNNSSTSSNPLVNKTCFGAVFHFKKVRGREGGTGNKNLIWQLFLL